jgi:putative acetyltransferase
MRQWRSALFVRLAVGGVYGIYVLGFTLAHRDRPPVKILDPGLVPNHSFPSGHVAAATALWGAVVVLARAYFPAVARWLVPVLVVIPPLVLVSGCTSAPTTSATRWSVAVRVGLAGGSHAHSPARPGGRTVTIRAARPDDDVAPVIRAAFGSAHGQDVAALWAEVVREGLVLAELVDEQDDVIVGHVGLSRAWLDARRELVDIWLLGPLSVLPCPAAYGHRQRAARCRGGRRPRRGGTDAGARRQSGVLRQPWVRARQQACNPSASSRTPDAASQVVVFDGREDWMTGQIVYRDVWWRHDAAGLRDPRLSDVEQQLAALED